MDIKLDEAVGEDPPLAQQARKGRARDTIDYCRVWSSMRYGDSFLQEFKGREISLEMGKVLYSVDRVSNGSFSLPQLLCIIRASQHHHQDKPRELIWVAEVSSFWKRLKGLELSTDEAVAYGQRIISAEDEDTDQDDVHSPPRKRRCLAEVEDEAVPVAEIEEDLRRVAKHIEKDWSQIAEEDRSREAEVKDESVARDIGVEDEAPPRGSQGIGIGGFREGEWGFRGGGYARGDGGACVGGGARGGGDAGVHEAEVQVDFKAVGVGCVLERVSWTLPCTSMQKFMSIRNFALPSRAGFPAEMSRRRMCPTCIRTSHGEWSAVAAEHKNAGITETYTRRLIVRRGRMKTRLGAVSIWAKLTKAFTAETKSRKLAPAEQSSEGNQRPERHRRGCGRGEAQKEGRGRIYRQENLFQRECPACFGVGI